MLLATRLGSRGYLPATLPLAEVVGAIRLVSDGGAYVPACVLAAASLGQSPPVRPRDGHGNPIEFSPRELHVLALLQQGKQNKVIAYELGICESTTKVHIRHIMKKLAARNRTQVVSMTKGVTGVVPIRMYQGRCTWPSCRGVRPVGGGPSRVGQNRSRRVYIRLKQIVRRGASSSSAEDGFRPTWSNRRRDPY